MLYILVKVWQTNIQTNSSFINIDFLGLTLYNALLNISYCLSPYQNLILLCYRCKYCPRTFGDTSNRNKHIREAHHDQYMLNKLKKAAKQKEENGWGGKLQQSIHSNVYQVYLVEPLSVPWLILPKIWRLFDRRTILNTKTSFMS